MFSLTAMIQKARFPRAWQIGASKIPKQRSQYYIFVEKILQISISNVKCYILAKLVKSTRCAKEILFENKLNLQNCSQLPSKSTDFWVVDSIQHSLFGFWALGEHWAPNTTAKFPLRAELQKQHSLVERRALVLGDQPIFLGNHRS